MKYGWKVYFLWYHMKSIEFLYLIFIMTWLENHILYICSSILCYIMIIHIYMGAPMMFTYVTWRLVILLAPCLVHLMLRNFIPHLGEDIYDWRTLLLESKHYYFMMIYKFMGVLMRLLWATWILHVFFAPYLVQILVEVLHSLLAWKNTWLIILMHIIYFWRSIMGHGILTYVIGQYLI